MNTKKLFISEDALVDLLKSIPEKKLVNVIWRALVEYEITPLNVAEKKAIKKGMAEFKKKKTVAWQALLIPSVSKVEQKDIERRYGKPSRKAVKTVKIEL